MFIKEEELEIVKQIIKKIIPDHKVLAFGSRVSGQYLKKFSDLDLAILGGPLSLEIFAKLTAEFENSSLPFKVDIVDYQEASDNFKCIIDSSCKPLQDL